VGRPTYCSRAALPWLRRGRLHRRPIPTARPEAALANLADLFGEPRGPNAAIDFFTVPTATFRILYCCLVLRHARRTAVHFNITAHPTAGWAAQQIVEAFPYGQTPRFLLHDRDGVFGDAFRRRVRGVGIAEVRIAPHAPWQNPYLERLIGSIRRECLDHVIVLGEAHLRRILSAYLHYYHAARPHLALARDAAVPRAAERRRPAQVLAIPQVGGLHHRYARAA
jgi:transposase InsO family protein